MDRRRALLGGETGASGLLSRVGRHSGRQQRAGPGLLLVVWCSARQPGLISIMLLLLLLLLATAAGCCCRAAQAVLRGRRDLLACFWPPRVPALCRLDASTTPGRANRLPASTSHHHNKSVTISTRGLSSLIIITAGLPLQPNHILRDEPVFVLVFPLVPLVHVNRYLPKIFFTSFSVTFSFDL